MLPHSVSLYVNYEIVINYNNCPPCFMLVCLATVRVIGQQQNYDFMSLCWKPVTLPPNNVMF